MWVQLYVGSCVCARTRVLVHVDAMDQQGVMSACERAYGHVCVGVGGRRVCVCMYPNVYVHMCVHTGA